MLFRAFILSALCLATAAAADPAPAPMPPAEAIAAVDRSARGVRGRFEMVVAATGKGEKAIFLNSKPDYRAPGNVTFSMSHAVAAALEKRFGVRPEVYLRGRRIVADGIMEGNPIVNFRHGKIRSFNRVSYTLQIRQVAQIVAIE
jgi:hypothetical protein